MNRPAYLLDIPADEYHAATKRNEYTTSHRLHLFRKCPALYKKTIDGEIVEGDTAAFALGRATHTYIIEGAEKFAAENIVSDGPTNEKTGKPYGKLTKAYMEWATNQTKPVVSSEDFELIEKMNEAVHAHRIAADLLAAGFAEGTIRTEWDGVPIQARLDWFDPEREILLDLKTCADIDRFQFDMRDHGYVAQLAFYANALELAGGPKLIRLMAYIVAVEKKEPYRVAVYHIAPSTLEDAHLQHMGSEFWRNDNTAMIAELKECRRTGVWPTRFEAAIIV
jgi:hypothetical protein